jgi:hypothetical protein
MMFIASLVEFPIAKNADVAKTQIPLGEFRYGQFACYLVSSGPLLGCRHIEMSSAESASVNGKESRSAEFFTVVSTVGQIFGAKPRNSGQHGANA